MLSSAAFFFSWIANCNRRDSAIRQDYPISPVFLTMESNAFRTITGTNTAGRASILARRSLQARPTFARMRSWADLNL